MFTNTPKHVAIIMDGNTRWAKLNNLSTKKGHHEGMMALKKVVKAAAECKIKYLTVYAFSTENWNRSRTDISQLLNLFVSALKDNVNELHENNVKLHYIGNISKFSKPLQKQMLQSEEKTFNNDAITLSLAMNYGGRWDIVNACKTIAGEVLAGKISNDEINEKLFSNHLSLEGLPEVDLCIRSGGELRISNFLLWQCAYAEFYFCNTLWPDFDAEDLHLALTSFDNRQRRFGSQKVDSLNNGGQNE